MTSSPLTALVVGASRGLGLGLVHEFVARDWNVVATARTPDKATELAAFAQAHPARVVVEPLDVEDGAAIDALRGTLDGGRLDVLFVNAGMFGPQHQDVQRVTRDELATLFLTNAIAPVRIAERFADRMADGGVVALMTSQLGSIAENTSGGYALYRASKAALNSLARSFAAAQRGRRITVLAMHPGWVRTAMGGENAPLDVPTSARGMVDVVLEKRGGGKHGFVDYRGAKLPW
jgi:NAD(P)-dependent dehydrogenase (short-subunit alcohol dehydrogenase family)